MARKQFQMRALVFPTWTVPLALLTYGFMLPRLGFYWDDWAKISVQRQFGPGGYQAYYAEDRPLSAWTHLVFNALLGETPQTPLPDWSPPQTMFGPEPGHGWCCYFEKGELNAQLQNWPAVAALGDQARQKGNHPQAEGSDAPREWQPFIRAYAHQGRWAEAGDLCLQAIQVQPEDSPALCSLWQELDALLANPEKITAQGQVNLALRGK